LSVISLGSERIMILRSLEVYDDEFTATLDVSRIVSL
jgi:hypothetical protein